MTLVECMLAIAVLGGIVTATALTITTGARHLARADRAERAARLGRDMVEEILCKSYQEPDKTPLFGPEPGEATRAAFNDVDDFNGFSENAGALKDASGQLYPTEDQRFSRSVTVTSHAQTVSELGTTFPGVNVVIAVTHQSGEKWQFSRYIPKPQ
jgi:hypothetical protein